MVDTEKVAEHYKCDGLTARIAAALAAAGLETGILSIEQLAPLDQFHSRGFEATVELGKVLQPSSDDRVVDIGSGLGGPSRYLASTYGCDVTGVDLSESFVEAAQFLAERTGLAGNVRYLQGDALSLPFDIESFDIAWTQHVAMNVANRQAFYSEAYRMLRPGGRLAIYDVLAGGAGPLIYPVPWAQSAEASFLMTPVEMRTLVTETGFEVLSWVDRTDAALAWFGALRASQATPAATGGVGLHLAMGQDFKTMTGNLARNLEEGRAVLIEAVLVKRRNA